MTKDREKGVLPNASRSSERLVAVLQETYGGPLPHPAVLEEFKRLIPGSETVFLEELKEESRHRRDLARLEIETRATLRRRAQWGALVVALGIIAGATVVLSTSTNMWAQIAAGIMAVVGIGGPTVARIVVERNKLQRSVEDQETEQSVPPTPPPSRR